VNAPRRAPTGAPRPPRGEPPAIAPHPGRTHPPSLIRLAERAVRDDRLFGRGDLVLCACSGGPDSTALLHVLALLRRRFGHEVIAHGVDHGLRLDATTELSLAERVAEAVGVPFGVTRVEVSPGSNLQARAREARLHALGEAATRAGAQRIATGHTADDRAETFLLRLLRGAGPRGLAVLPSSAPGPAGTTLIRPLLDARRIDVLAHLGRHALAFADDPSNQDPRFTRVRVRKELLPLLEDLSPRIVEHLTALAEMLAASPGAAVAVPVVELGREQRRAVERARRLGRGALRLRLRGGNDVEVTFPEGKIILSEK
jgi:tRNA(Ile)-lysidine synthase